MKRLLAAAAVAALVTVPVTAADLFERVDHHVVSNDGVDIHYVRPARARCCCS